MHIFVTKWCIVGICLMHCGICKTVLLKTIRRYAIMISVNQHGVPQYYTYLSQRLQIFCHVYIYIFKTNQNKSKIRSWYVFY